MEKVIGIKERGVRHQPNTPLLSVSGVQLAYTPGESGSTFTLRGRQTEETIYALRDITFQIDGGERVAVVGPNGAGKSTLFKVIAGTLKPERGTIEVFGHDPQQHICIAYVPQRNQIDWSFPVTVEDVVMMGRVGQIGLFRRPSRHDWQTVRASLERVNAGHLRKKQIGELSGGQQQRVFIARALAQQAELLMLDEPFTGLDVPSQEKLFEVLDTLHRDGVTLLVATHDLNLAAEHFDRVMLLNKTIVSYGPPADVLTSQNLLRAYGGHMHVIDDDSGAMLLTDTCCEGEDELLVP
jgi:ABC-type Mn2+/Zn2+ transport system ATPase subunit